MALDVSTVKGFSDYLFPESLKRDAVRRVTEKHFKLHGFMPIETPIIEYDELMRPDTLPNEQTDEAISDRFKLKDRAGRNLGLRYEFTFQLQRIFKENPTLKMPFRRYQIGPVFRDEPIGTGRTRQFVQCDADIAGDATTHADAQILAVFADILSALGIDFEMHINNRKLLQAIIESVEIDKLKIKDVMRELDKLDKLSEDEVKINLRKFANANQIITLFKLLEKDAKFFKENKFEGIDEILSLTEQCARMKIKTIFNPSLARGLSYYTGNIFEVRSEKTTLAGGGRYDRSIGKYIGREVPAVGLSFSLERVSSLATLPVEGIAHTALISIGQEAHTEKLAQVLRKKEISCISFSEKPGKALEYANAYAIPYAIFIGSDEVEQKKFKLRNLSSGEEELVTEKQLIAKLQK